MELTKKQYKFTYLKKIIIKVLLVAAPIILLILPADFFDSGQSMCISILLLNIECYGCGMTRAIMHLLHADFESAYMFNKLSFIVFPLLVVLYIKMFALYFFNKKILKGL